MSSDASLRSDLGDKMALRELVERYAQAVDAKDGAAAAALFTEDGRLVSHLMPGTEDEPLVRSGRAKVQRALEMGLAQYRLTTHVIGGQVIEDLSAERAAGVTQCLAHHLVEEDGHQRLMVMAIRYHDSYARSAEGWRFAERRLKLEWRTERRLEE